MPFGLQSYKSALTASLSSVKSKQTTAMARRKILFLDHTASLGGGELALLQIVEHLDKCRYHPVVVLCSEGKLVERLAAAEIETHVIPLNSRVTTTRKDNLGVKSLLQVRDVGATMAYAFQLANFIREHRIDLVHTNSLKADIIGGLAARIAGRPVIWHIRDRIDTDYLPASVVRVFRTLCRLVPDYVMANSTATMKTLHLPRKDRTMTVYSGVDTDQCVVPDALANGMLKKALPQHSRTQGDGPCIGLVGRISPWKGQHIFLQAAAQVRKRFPAARFQIVGAVLFGEEEYEREVHRLTTELGLGEAVEFTGFRSDVQDIMANMDILVHASTTGEPFGQVVVQGMSAGKPVVATNGGGIPEIVVDGQTGLLVPMSDADAMAAAISHLLANPELAQQMGLMGRQRVLEHFTIDHTVLKVEQVYESLLAPLKH